MVKGSSVPARRQTETLAKALQGKVFSMFLAVTEEPFMQQPAKKPLLQSMLRIVPCTPSVKYENEEARRTVVC